MTIFEKLGAVQAALKAPKNQYNKFGGYKYRNCEDILEAVKPLCVANKCMIYLSDDICQKADRLYVQATAHFCDVEAEKELIATAYAREEEAKKGMDGSQVTGASSSYARKYALNGLLCIDDTKDSDTTNTGDGQPKPQGTARTRAAKPSDKSDEPFLPATPAAQAARDPALATDEQKKAVLAASGGGEELSKCLQYFGVDSVDKLSAQAATAALQIFEKKAARTRANNAGA